MRLLAPLLALWLASAAFLPIGDAEPSASARLVPPQEQPPTTEGVDGGASALDLAKAMATDPGNVYHAEFVTIPPFGTPTAVSLTAMTGFPTHQTSFAILSSGNAEWAGNPNQSPGTSAGNGGGNVRGNSDYDVVILKVQLKSLPTHFDTCVSVDFRFLTEEFPEFVGSEFNDAFIAESAVSTWSTQDSTITAPNNFAWRTPGDIVSITPGNTNELTASAATGTTYDGATPLYRAATLVTPTLVGVDVVYEVFFSIFDQGDDIYDSAVFLDNLDLYTGGCSTGAVKIAD